MDYVRFTRARKYICVNGALTVSRNIDAPRDGLNGNLRQRVPEEVRAARRAREQERIERARLRQEQQREEEERVRQEHIMAQVEAMLAARMEQFRVEFQRAAETQRMEVEDDDVLICVPEPFAVQEINIVENIDMLGLRGANDIHGKTKIMFIKNYVNR